MSSFNKILKHLPLGKDVEIVDKDPNSGLFTLNKPGMVRSHPNEEGFVDPDALIVAKYNMRDQCYLLEDGTRVYLLNRLDAPTSGLVLLTTDFMSAEEVRQAFKMNAVKKFYYAVVMGRVNLQKKVWKDMLEKKVRQGNIRVTVGGDQLAETLVSQLEYSEKLNLTLLKLQPITGRTHQLRVQCSLRNNPILGDKTYGDFRFNAEIIAKLGLHPKRLFLHAAEITVKLGEGELEYTFHSECPLPAFFEDIFKKEEMLENAVAE